jgi:hypothetical protein
VPERLASQTHRAPAIPEHVPQHRALPGLGCPTLLQQDGTPPQRIHLGLLDEFLVMCLGIR